MNEIMSTLHEWKAANPAEVWTGPINGLESKGLNTWAGKWHNSAGEVKDLLITLETDNNQIIINEDGSPRQTWVGDFKIEDGLYLVKGSEVGRVFDFSARLKL